MPTGYTAVLGEREVSFKEFTQRCARAFGATIMLRDEPLGNELPDDMPNSLDYHRKNIHKSEMRISRLRNATPNQLRSRMLRDIMESAQYAHEGRQKALELQGRYSRMLVQVGAWEPPTEDHQGLKKFMIDQIVESGKYDCRVEYYDQKDASVMDALRTMTPEQWRDKLIAEELHSIEYHRKEMKKEKERHSDRIEWIRKLKESLDDPMFEELAEFYQ